MNVAIISFLAVTAYLMAGVGLGMRLSRGQAAPFGKTRLLLLGMGAVILHALVLYQAIITPQGTNLGFFNATSLLTWMMALLLLLAALVKPIENLGIALLPLAALAMILAAVFPSDHIMSLHTGFGGLDVHIIISVLAYSLLSIAAVQAGLLAIQDVHLHDKHPGGFIRALPPLQTAEKLLFQVLTVGFILLTLSLLTGAIFLENIFAQHLVHKTSLSILAWIVFGILLWGRWRSGWRGRRAIRWTLGGFFVLVLAYIGSKLVLELVLGIK